jgi:hypothetical protein
MKYLANASTAPLDGLEQVARIDRHAGAPWEEEECVGAAHRRVPTAARRVRRCIDVCGLIAHYVVPMRALMPTTRGEMWRLVLVTRLTGPHFLSANPPLFVDSLAPSARRGWTAALENC